MRTSHLTILLAVLGLAAGPVDAQTAAQGPSGREDLVTGDPVETLDSRLLPAPGEEDREFRVGTLEGAPVVLGDESVGVVRDVALGLEEQRGFVVEYAERLGGHSVLIPIGETVIRDGRVVVAYTLDQLRALPTLRDYRAANLSPIADDETLRLRRSELEPFEVETTGSRVDDPVEDGAAR